MTEVQEHAGLSSAGVLVHDLLVATARRRPEHIALHANGRARSFAEVDAASDAVARWLQDAGVTRGDRVAIMMENSAEIAIALFGVLKAGGVFVIVNATTKADTLSYLLDDCQVRVVVASSRLARVVLPALASAESIVASAWVGGVPPDLAGAVEVDDVIAAGGVPSSPGLIDSDLAAIIYTSGSTGVPKGVMLTHRNLHHSTWSIATYLELDEDDVVACVLPLSFGYGLSQVLLGARVGCTVVIERSFAFPSDVLRRVDEMGVTVLPGVPTIFATILQMTPFEGFSLERVRMITNAAAALPPAHIRRFQELLPHAKIFSMYGLTECTRVSYLDPARLTDKLGSVGQAMPNTEAYVVDERGVRVPPGTVGELVVRGASVMRGYWGKPDETAACLKEGEIAGELVLHTGDQFTMDDEGFLFFVGRTDDVFKCKGEKVSPKEIEHVLYELDDVREAAVVGTPDPIDGMAVTAVVALCDGARLTADDIRRHCRARVEPYMVPKHVEILAELPKTATGKIRKTELVRG